MDALAFRVARAVQDALDRNIVRIEAFPVSRCDPDDAQVEEALASAGWPVVTIWECETRDREKLKELLSAALSGRTRRRELS